MSQDELSRAQINLDARMRKEEQWAASIQEAVDLNAQLLTAVLERTQGLEVFQAAVTVRGDENVKATETLKDDLKQGLQLVHDKALQNEKTLRGQLDEMAARLDASTQELNDKINGNHKELWGRLDAIATAAASGTGPPGYDVVALGEQIREITARLAESGREVKEAWTAVSRHELGLKELHESMHKVQNAVQEAATAAAQARAMAETAHATAAAAHTASATQHAAGVDPMAGGRDAWSQGRSAPAGGPPTPPTRPQTFDMGSPPGVPRGADIGGKWRLYDEKLLLTDKLVYSSKSPQTWLQDVRDYLAGRTSEIDRLLDWTESQTEEITAESLRVRGAGIMD